MGYNYHHIRPQLFSCSSFKLSSVTHRQKKSSNQLSNSQQVNVWVSTLAKHDRHCSSMMNSVCVGGGLYCCFCDTTLFHTCSSREKIYSFSWNLIPSEQSLINLYLPQVGVGLPSLWAPHLFCSPFASAIAAFISRQQKFYATLFSPYWHSDEMAWPKMTGNRFPLARAATQRAAFRRYDVPCLTTTHQ